MSAGVGEKRPDLGLAALHYASRRGWAVFPLEQEGKRRSLVDRGVRDASRKPELVRQWWKRWPHANIGLATGPASGVDVLDINGVEGEQALAKLVSEHGPLPATYESRTASGRHLFFWTDPNVQTYKNLLGPSLDVHGEGGWVVLPPSMHPNQHPYLWTVGLEELEVVAHWPRWMVERIREAAQQRAAAQPEPKASASDAEEGFRGYVLDEVSRLIADWQPLDEMDRREIAKREAQKKELREEGKSESEISMLVSDWPHTPIEQVVIDCAKMGADQLDELRIPNHQLRQTIIHAWATHDGIDKTVFDLRRLEAAIAKGIEQGDKAIAREVHIADEKAQRKRARRARKGGSGGGKGGGGGGGGGGGDDGGDDGFRDHFGGWFSQLELTKKEREPKSSLGNLLILVDQHPSWRGKLGYNERTGHTVWLEQPPWDPENRHGPYPRQVRDADEAPIVKWFEKLLHIEFASTKVHKALLSVAQSHSFDRVREYLLDLEWDGRERIDGWLIDYFGADANELNEAVGSRWLISAVARTLEPGCQVDHVIVLEGKQGAGKSTGLRALCPRNHWFTDQMGDVRSKDASETLQGPWIIEIAELDALRRAEAQSVKAFITRQSDRYRGAYARHVTDRKRRCVFAATTNDSHYLKDSTGNRRYWPVEVKGPIKVDAIRKVRDQLWAEAVVRYKAGEQWYIDEPHLVQMAMSAQEQRYDADEWENILEDWLNRVLLDTTCKPDGPRYRIGLKSPNDPIRVTVGNCLAQVGFKDSKDWERRHQMRIADILGRMGWKRARRRDGKAGKPRWAYEPTIEAAKFAPKPGTMEFSDDEDEPWKD